VPGVLAQEYAYDAQLRNEQGQLFPIAYLYGASLTNLPSYGLPEQHVAPGVPLAVTQYLSEEAVHKTFDFLA
jgi:hypothetical protein